MSDQYPPERPQAGGRGDPDPRWPDTDLHPVAPASSTQASWGGSPAPWSAAVSPHRSGKVPAGVAGGRPRPAEQWWVLPGTRVAYHGMLRGPKRRWWRPPLALLVALVIVFAGGALALLPTAIVGVLMGVDLEEWLDFEAIAAGQGPGPGALLYLLLTLAALIPATGLSVWLVHRVRPGFVSSISGGLRWRWLLRVAALVAPLFALYLGLVTVLEHSGERPEQWVAILVIAVLLAPLQAAGEEYFFRGWILQNVGSYFRRPLLGLGVATAVSAATFAAAHGSPDPLLVSVLVVMSISTCYLTWRTGGLESAIVIHATNNVGTTIVTVTVGGYSESFIDADTRGTWLAVALQVVLHTVLVAVVVWQARRAGIQRWYEPPAAITGPPPTAGWPSWPPTSSGYALPPGYGDSTPPEGFSSPQGWQPQQWPTDPPPPGSRQ